MTVREMIFLVTKRGQGKHESFPPFQSKWFRLNQNYSPLGAFQYVGLDSDEVNQCKDDIIQKFVQEQLPARISGLTEFSLEFH